VTSTKVPVLRIYGTETWAGPVAPCEKAILDVLAKKVHRVTRSGCVAVQSYANHWPCVIPQHGPGEKHERPIVLADWQRVILGSFRKISCAVFSIPTAAA
jgi:hypothetical protein